MIVRSLYRSLEGKVSVPEMENLLRSEATRIIRYVEGLSDRTLSDTYELDIYVMQFRGLRAHLGELTGEITPVIPELAGSRLGAAIVKAEQLEAEHA